VTGLVVRLAGPGDHAALHALRHVVFVEGQGVPEDLERDEQDERCDHAVALLDGVVVGTGRLLAPGDRTATVGRMAVAAEARRAGVGSAVLRRLEERARERGWPAVELHAQVHARAFYELAGYTPVGSTYLEAGIEHLTMRKQLTPG